VAPRGRPGLLGAARQILDVSLRSEDGTVLLDAQSLAALLPARRLARVWGCHRHRRQTGCYHL